jgi:hypothetical protein
VWLNMPLRSNSLGIDPACYAAEPEKMFRKGTSRSRHRRFDS